MEVNRENSLESRIAKINREIDKFAAAWIGQSLPELPADIKPVQLANILEPGLDLINRGGKRWRPLLMQLFCEMAGGGDTALSLTPLVEIAHNGTLIADDIEDNSDIRRGAKAIHLKYGLDMALNTGNFMCFLPSLLIESKLLPPPVKLLVYKYYLEDMRNLHIGQGLDIQWHNAHAYIPTAAEYFFMCRLKTGTLARMAARLGYIIGGGAENTANLAGNICEDFGVGFQIMDDIKNLTTGNPGKKVGDDIIEGKKSLPIILYIQANPAGREKIISLLQAVACAKKGKHDRKIREVIGILTASDCIMQAQQKADELISNARDNITNQFPASPARTAVLEVFDLLGKA